MFARLGRWCHDHRRIVVGLWIVGLMLLGGVSSFVGTDFRDEFNLPDSESRDGFDILEKDFGGQGTGQPGTIVFLADQGVNDPKVKASMQAWFTKVDALPDIKVTSPYSREGGLQIARTGPRAGEIAFAAIEVPYDTSFEEAQDIRKAIIADQPKLTGVQSELGGVILAEFEQPSSEMLGLAFAIFILIVAFGSVMAMGLPIGVALAGIGIGVIIIGLLSQLVAMPEFASIIAVMIGLGVGIDYALFIVTRFREGLHHNHSVGESVAIAIDTSGRAVAFAGVTVIISLLGMVVMGVGFVTGMAIAAATVVLVTVAASLTLLPALLGFVGTRVEVTRWRGIIAAGLASIALIGVALKIQPLTIGAPLAVVVIVAGVAFAPLKKEVPRREVKPVRETPQYRWSRFVQHHSWASVFLGVLILVVMAIPVFSLRLGFSDEGNAPEESSTRKAYDLLAEGFGPGFNGPFLVVTELPNGAKSNELAKITKALSGAKGIAFASPAVPNDPTNPTAVLWRVIPTTAPQDEATTQLVSRLRNEVLPPVEVGTGLDVFVTGSVPVGVDFSSYLGSRLPWFFMAVLSLSFLLLMAVFRSLLVPLKAVVMNLLSIGASYGLVIALFQWGWLGDITGIEPAPIEPFIPMMLFAIVFGLSMDYEVFLLSRIREEWVRTGDSRESVADGLAATAKVITAAAAIMVFVFGSFLLEADRIPKLMGVGLASAVLLDATIVRMLLVPATMELLGDRNWWLPRWLDRLLPTINVEGDAEDVNEELEIDLLGEGSDLVR